MTHPASIIVGRRRVQTRDALVCSTGGFAHGYELFFCSLKLHGRLQEQAHDSLRSGFLRQRQLATYSAQSKPHRSHRIRRKR
jgi:hypothetical protein